VRSTDTPHKSDAYRFGSVALLGALGAIGLALGFEYIGGMKPCVLCLQQRWAYYAAIPALFAGLILLSSGKTTAGGLLFLLVSIAFLVNAGLGTYHAGVEWGFWAGPETCSGTVPSLGRGTETILDRLKGNQSPIVRCDAAPGRFLGLSFAGWNVISSMLLWIISQSAAFATTRNRAI
jgi:disulfide bond formation protein DsbB